MKNGQKGKQTCKLKHCKDIANLSLDPRTETEFNKLALTEYHD